MHHLLILVSNIVSHDVNYNLVLGCCAILIYGVSRYDKEVSMRKKEFD